MSKDRQPHEPSDAESAAVTKARADLETARKSERVGSIAVAQVRLSSTFARSGLHTEAVTEYDQLLSYLQMAASDGQQGTPRWPGMSSPAAPPSRSDAVNLSRLETLARLNRVESLLELGLRDEARTGLARVAPMCRGFRRKAFRKKLAHLQKRLAETGASTAPGSAVGHSPVDSRSKSATDPVTGPATTLPERLTTADATLGRGEARAAALEAVGIVADCGEDDHCRAQARQILGMALDVMGKSEESLATMKLAFDDYLASEDFTQAANLAIPIAVRLEVNGERLDAIALIELCLAEAQGEIADSVRARLNTVLGRFLDEEEDRAKARRIFESACEMAPDVRTRADAEYGLAVSLADDGTADAEQSVEALVLIDAAKSGYSELGSIDRVAGCEHEAAALLGRLKSFPAAESRYQKALAGYGSLDSERIDAALIADEIADCQLNILAIQSQETSESTLFRSGGHRS